MIRFRGIYSGTLDQKGRLNLPSKFRRLFTPEDNDTVILLKGSAKSILIYPLKVWEQVEDELLLRRKESPNYSKVIRQLNAMLDEQHLDKQGRITIPQRLKDKAAINKDVVIVGNLTHMEIWDAQEFDKQTSDAPDVLSILEEELGI
ncbi:MAG: division/cell wall cluster transcriptional repressor MraZ [Calditrichia bacterium]